MAVVTYFSLGALRVDIDGKWRPNYWLIAYYVLCILIMANLASFFWGRGQSLAAMAIVPMLLLLFVMFGIRWNWFMEKAPPGKTAADDACANAISPIQSPNTPYPPIVNMCPDFMTAWKDSTNDKIYCYDANNTYNMKTYNGAGLKTNLTINGLSGQSAYLLFDPSKNIEATNPTTDDGGHRWPLYALIENNFATLSNDPQGKYLKWEGIIQSSGNRYDFWKYNIMRVLPGISGKLPSVRE
jgi:hypothetical protein